MQEKIDELNDEHKPKREAFNEAILTAKLSSCVKANIFVSSTTVGDNAAPKPAPRVNAGTWGAAAATFFPSNIDHDLQSADALGEDFWMTREPLDDQICELAPLIDCKPEHQKMAFNLLTKLQNAPARGYSQKFFYLGDLLRCVRGRCQHKVYEALWTLLDPKQLNVTQEIFSGVNLREKLLLRANALLLAAEVFSYMGQSTSTMGKQVTAQLNELPDIKKEKLFHDYMGLIKVDTDCYSFKKGSRFRLQWDTLTKTRRRLLKAESEMLLEQTASVKRKRDSAADDNPRPASRLRPS